MHLRFESRVPEKDVSIPLFKQCYVQGRLAAKAYIGILWAIHIAHKIDYNISQLSICCDEGPSQSCRVEPIVPVISLLKGR